MAAPDKPVAAEHTSTQSAPAAASQSDAQGYAAREHKDQKTADFQGGQLIIVGVSGAA